MAYFTCIVRYVTIWSTVPGDFASLNSAIVVSGRQGKAKIDDGQV